MHLVRLQEAQQSLMPSTRNYCPFSFHLAWTTRAGKSEVSSNPSSVVLLMEGRSSSRNDACKGRGCVEKLCRNHRMSGRKRVHTGSLKTESCWYGNVHTKNGKKSMGESDPFPPKSKVHSHDRAAKPTQHLSLPHV